MLCSSIRQKRLSPIRIERSNVSQISTISLILTETEPAAMIVSKSVALLTFGTTLSEPTIVFALPPPVFLTRSAYYLRLTSSFATTMTTQARIQFRTFQGANAFESEGPISGNSGRTAEFSEAASGEMTNSDSPLDDHENSKDLESPARDAEYDRIERRRPWTLTERIQYLERCRRDPQPPSPERFMQERNGRPL